MTLRNSRPMEELPITQTPPTLIEAIGRSLTDYSVGFVRIDDSPLGEDAMLLGSGTLVCAGNVHAVLTAHHVVMALPQTGRLGLILSYTLHRDTIDTQGLRYLKIARGSVDSEGPDLGAIILTPTITDALSAKKVFYNLALRQEQLLQAPPAIDEGLWFIHGFIAERTVEELGVAGYRIVKGFYNLSGAGCVEPSISVGDHDYFAFPVSFGSSTVAPQSFGGMSGGGLWQVPIVRDTQGNLMHKTPLLSGVVFYQQVIAANQCAIKSHGRRSVYRVAYDAINEI